MVEAIAMNFLKTKPEGHWRTYEYCSIDIESTGLDLKKDEVISVGAVKISEGRFKGDANFYEEIAPKQNPSIASIQVHGLRGVDLRSAKSADVVVKQLVAHVQDRYLVAHAGWIEKAFLSSRLKHHGYKYPKEFIDTASLARFLGLAERAGGLEPSLEHLARRLNLPIYSPHHALGDAMTTAAVFLALTNQIERKMSDEGGATLTLQRLLEISTQNRNS
jgi:DNA polymerase-3 subunit epsilon